MFHHICGYCKGQHSAKSCNSGKCPGLSKTYLKIATITPVKLKLLVYWLKGYEFSHYLFEGFYQRHQARMRNEDKKVELFVLDLKAGR
jgi:hypothetical protein